MLSSYTLLKPKHLAPREGAVVLDQVPAPTEVDALVRPYLTGVVALDFETKGLPLSSASHPVGVGLSSSHGSIYLPLSAPVDGVPCPVYARLMRLLKEEQTPLLAHNVGFDGMWPLRDFGLWLNWRCTYTAARLTATEGWLGQQWSLKVLMVELLGWAEPNTALLYSWLEERGLKKEEMWQAPASILGTYCALDADATWQLWEFILSPVIDSFPVLGDLFHNHYPRYTELLCRSTLKGIEMDRTMLMELDERYAKEIESRTREFLTSDLKGPSGRSIREANEAYRDQCVAEVKQTEPPRYLKQKLGKEPPKLKKKRLLTQKEFDILCSRYLTETDLEGNILLYEKT